MSVKVNERFYLNNNQNINRRVETAEGEKKLNEQRTKTVKISKVNGNTLLLISY